ncbi:MAG: tetratricopeptide repeat protein [Pseudomonadota bacterium]
MTESAPLRQTPWLLIAPAVLAVALLVPMSLHGYRQWCDQRDVDQAVARHLARADKALEAHDYHRVEVATTAALHLRPNDPDLIRRMREAQVLGIADNPAALKDDDSAFLEAASYAAEELIERGGPRKASYLLCAGHLALRRGDTAKAQAAYEQAVAAAPTTAAPQLALGNLFQRLDRPLEALTAYEAAVKNEPQSLVALNNVGVHYVNLGRHEEGRMHLERALAIKDNATTRLNLANALVSLKRATEAIAHLTRATELAPTSPDLFDRLGALQLANGKTEEAEKALRRSLELKQNPGTTVTLAQAYQAQNRHDRAVEVLAALLKTQPDFTPATYALGVSLEALGAKDAALTAFQRVLRQPAADERVDAAARQYAKQAIERLQNVTPGRK